MERRQVPSTFMMTLRHLSKVYPVKNTKPIYRVCRVQVQNKSLRQILAIPHWKTSTKVLQSWTVDIPTALHFYENEAAGTPPKGWIQVIMRTTRLPKQLASFETIQQFYKDAEYIKDVRELVREEEGNLRKWRREHEILCECPGAMVNSEVYYVLESHYIGY